MDTEQQPWNIETICTALGHPTVAQRFLDEINRATGDRIAAVFAKWEAIAQQTVAAVARARADAAIEAAGGEIPGDWIDGTEKVLADAARIRARRAA